MLSAVDWMSAEKRLVTNNRASPGWSANLELLFPRASP